MQFFVGDDAHIVPKAETKSKTKGLCMLEILRSKEWHTCRGDNLSP